MFLVLVVFCVLIFLFIWGLYCLFPRLFQNGAFLLYNTRCFNFARGKSREYRREVIPVWALQRFPTRWFLTVVGRVTCASAYVIRHILRAPILIKPTRRIRLKIPRKYFIFLQYPLVDLTCLLFGYYSSLLVILAICRIV